MYVYFSIVFIWYFSNIFISLLSLTYCTPLGWLLKVPNVFLLFSGITLLFFPSFFNNQPAFHNLSTYIESNHCHTIVRCHALCWFIDKECVALSIFNCPLIEQILYSVTMFSPTPCNNYMAVMERLLCKNPGKNSSVHAKKCQFP